MGSDLGNVKYALVGVTKAVDYVGMALAILDLRICLNIAVVEQESAEKRVDWLEMMEVLELPSYI